ncbi:MAG TPA: molybdopterin cofactor-binding domain-containing protein, partial [Steroidobacteraceae bacterium]
GQGRGIAVANWGNWGGKDQVGGTTAAVVAHVDVSHEGVLKVLQLDIAFDCGRVFNRDAVEAQMQGGLLFGLNMALNEELNIENGRIVEGNFDTYPMLRLADAPKLRVHFGGLTGAERSAEVGEPPVGPVGPAVANAIFAATGKRIRSMPFRKHDLRWA